MFNATVILRKMSRLHVSNIDDFSLMYILSKMFIRIISMTSDLSVVFVNG